MTSLRGKTALVTGASSGLGRDFAKQLAQRGCNVVIVARREDRLRSLAGKLERRHGVRVHVVPADLAQEETPQRIYDRTRELGLTVDVLINNAGLGLHGEFLETPWERERALLQVDLIAVVNLTKLFLRDMVARNAGYVMLIASTFAYQPMPTYACYAAAKSFILSFGEAVSYELRKTGVKVCVVSPGMMLTEFQQVAGQKPILFQRVASMPSDEMARRCLDSMLKGNTSSVPGVVNKLITFSGRLAPRRVAMALADAIPRIGMKAWGKGTNVTPFRARAGDGAVTVKRATASRG